MYAQTADNDDSNQSMVETTPLVKNLLVAKDFLAGGSLGGSPADKDLEQLKSALRCVQMSK